MRNLQKLRFGAIAAPFGVLVVTLLRELSSRQVKANVFSIGRMPMP